MLAALTASILGGLRFSDVPYFSLVRIILYLLLYALFLIFFYISFSWKAKLIFSICISVFTLIVELIIQLVFSCIKNTIAVIESSDDEPQEEKPDNIPEDVWALKDVIRNSNQDNDLLITDLIASGVDPNALSLLIIYLSGHSPPNRNNNDNSVMYISFFNHTFRSPFQKDFIEHNFSHHPWYFSILIPIFAFGATILPLLQSDELSKSAKAFTALIATTSIFSLIQSPDLDPYITTVSDDFICLTRSFYSIIFYGLYNVLQFFRDKTFHFPKNGWSFEWNSILPFIFQTLFYAYHLMPVFLLTGFLGQPITTLVSIFESICRYIFGQSGVDSLMGSILQIIHCAIAYVCVYFTLQYSSLGVSIIVATFVIYIPFRCSKTTILSGFIYQLLSTVLSCFALIPNSKPLFYVMVSIFTISELLYSILFTDTNYAIFQYTFIKNPWRFLHIARKLISQICLPFILSYFSNQSIDAIWSTLFIIQMISKNASEPRIVLFTILIYFGIRIDFDLSHDIFFFILSFLIANKVDSIIPITKLTFATRVNNVESNFFSLIGYLVTSYPFFIDHIICVPSYLFSCLTGAPQSPLLGSVALLLPSPQRPYYFWDHPPPSDDSFIRRVAEHQFEIPFYLSAQQSLVEKLGSLVASGKLGSVKTGQIFFMKSSNFGIFLHVIAQDPHYITFQIRGLEYDSRTVCHNTEINAISERLSFSSTSQSIASHTTVAQFVADNIWLRMYDVSRCMLYQAFHTVDNQNMSFYFFIAFAYVACKQEKELIDKIPEYNDAVVESNLSILTQMANYFHCDFDHAQLVKIIGMIVSMSRVIFSENGEILFSEITNAFTNHLDVPAPYNELPEVAKLYEKSIQFATGYIYNDGSIGLLPLPEYSDEVPQMIQEFDQDFEVGNIEDFSQGLGNKGFISVRDSQPSFIFRYSWVPTEWSIFKMNEEWVRGLWANEARSILYFQSKFDERNSIQADYQFFNNIIIQASDVPVGYPAYVSPIVRSYKKTFEPSMFPRKLSQ